ncbi:MAG: prolipoprotein diacylglyceryl transferase [Mediterranea sp.]|jgi:prolipoprotein diacylglyceryl transferase|nr:prolipoprotein diacylglyceryl transferase [Mediterranea sp.]
MHSLLTIPWNPNPELFSLFGLPIRYYGLLWAVGIFFAYLIVHYQYRDKKISDKTFEPLFFYCFFGVLIGARLGHCFFYDPERYLTSLQGIVEMVLPIKILPAGGWKFTGYEGLASHGGTIGLIVALWLYCRKTKMRYVDVLDMIAVATPATACCIRLANLMNSEIIGKPTDMPWAFIFERVDMQPRHPAQLYEAIAYLLLFFIMIYLYKKYSRTLHPGFFFGLCLTYIFTFRFFIEFLKENQEAFEASMPLNMGQLLSVPFVIIGIYFMFFYGRKSRAKA